jgi:hypothetical protein
MFIQKAVETGAIHYYRKVAICRPANNYFTWKDKCLAKPKIGWTFIKFSRTTDKEIFFIFFFKLARCFFQVMLVRSAMHLKLSNFNYRTKCKIWPDNS